MDMYIKYNLVADTCAKRNKKKTFSNRVGKMLVINYYSDRQRRDSHDTRYNFQQCNSLQN